MDFMCPWLNDRLRFFDEQEMQRKGEDIGEEEDDEWYSRKLEGGLFILQIVDYILGWICMEDDGVRPVLHGSLVCIDARPFRSARMSSLCSHGETKR